MWLIYFTGFNFYNKQIVIFWILDINVLAMPSNTSKNKEELLVGIVNLVSDYDIINNQFWYRIPVDSAEKMLKKRWPPDWIAFYYTVAIKTYPQMIIHYGKVSNITVDTRKELFPSENQNYKTSKKYYHISFDEIRILPKPILSRRGRRIVFIQTTFKKFIKAKEVNDLIEGSALEDKLWEEFKRNRICADRQEIVKISNNFYFLDFTIYCKKGKINIETDGDRWNHNAMGSGKDYARSNDLTSNGWSVIRFDSEQIHEKMETYCIPTIKTTINKLGGIDIDNDAVKRFLKHDPGASYPTYFEEVE